ncbi:MAG: PKD domain-containing protein [Acidimicrobiales bacterium]
MMWTTPCTVLVAIAATFGLTPPAAAGPAPTAGGEGAAGIGGIESNALVGGIQIAGGSITSATTTLPQSVGSSTGTWVRQIDERICGTTAEGVSLEISRTATPPPGFVPESTVTTWMLYGAGGGAVGSYEQNGCEGEPVPEPPPPLSTVFETAPLPEPVVFTSPGEEGLVALDNWFWYAQESTMGISPSIGSWSVVGVARAVRFSWDTGAGTVGSSVPGSPSGPAATHTYRRAGTYTLQASVTWTATFTFSGYGVTFGVGSESVTVTGPPRPYPVLQGEALVVD